MKKLDFSEESANKRDERIDAIVRRAKTPGNKTGLFFQLGSDVIVGCGGSIYNTAHLNVMFKSGGELVCLADSKKSDQNIWIFVDLKRNYCYVLVNNTFVNVDFVTVLYALPDPLGEFPDTEFEFGCYFSNDTCNVLYGTDNLRAISGIVRHYSADYTRLMAVNITEKEDDANV